jgi:hypothetical protein
MKARRAPGWRPIEGSNIPFSALPAVPLTNDQSGVTLKGLTTVGNLSVIPTNFVNYLVVTNPPALNGSAITNLNASQVAAGTVPLAQLPVGEFWQHYLVPSSPYHAPTQGSRPS